MVGLAWALHRSGDTDAAVPYAREALALHSAVPSFHVHAATVLAGAGRHGEATAVLTSLAASNPWLSPTLRDQAADLAVTLGVDPPPLWEPA